MALFNPYAHSPLHDLNVILEIPPWFPTVWFPSWTLSALIVPSVFVEYDQFLSLPGFLSVSLKAKDVTIRCVLFTVSLSECIH